MENQELPGVPILRTVFPVVAVEDASMELAQSDSFGTAFCMSPGVFLTAAHVAREARAAGVVMLGGPGGSGEPMRGMRVTEVEVWDNVDVAVLHVAASAAPLDRWLVQRVQVLTDVGSFGFPHAFTLDDSGARRIEVVYRGYKGYVVTRRRSDRLPARPPIYEVSCPFPKGMSGAPLFCHDEQHFVIAGLVIGTHKIHYRGFSQQVGAAVASDVILGLRSSVAGCALGELPGIVGAEFRFDGRPPADDGSTDQ